MQQSTEALQQEIRALEERLQQARRALQALHPGGSVAALDDELELIELSESDIIAEPDTDQLVERAKAPARPVADPWAGVSVSQAEPSVDDRAIPAVAEASVWPEPAPVGRDPLKTGTLAELYVSQGFTDKALAIYRDILADEPGNTTAAARIAELESPQSAGAVVMSVDELPDAVAALPVQGTADDRTVLPVLEGWLNNIRRIRECR